MNDTVYLYCMPLSTFAFSGSALFWATSFLHGTTFGCFGSFLAEVETPKVFILVLVEPFKQTEQNTRPPKNTQRYTARDSIATGPDTVERSHPFTHSTPPAGDRGATHAKPSSSERR